MGRPVKSNRARAADAKRAGVALTPRRVRVRVPGFTGGPARDRALFVASSGTLDAAEYADRVAMVKALGRRLLFDTLHAVKDGRVTMTELALAFAKGDAALAALTAVHRGKLVAPLYRKWLHQYPGIDKAKTAQRIERFLTAIGGLRGAGAATTDRITADAVASFLAGLTDLRTAGTTAAPAKASTANRYRAAIGVFCTWLVARGHLTTHPIAFKAVPKRAEPAPRLPRPFTPEDYRGYVGHVRAERPDLVPAFLLLLRTGADVGEVESRRVRDLDLTRTPARVHYARSKTNTPERTVPIAADVVAELRGHLAAFALAGDARLFGFARRRELVVAHQRAAAAIGRPSLTCKDLRHIAAMRWAQDGVPIPRISKYLGHATLAQTMVYADYAPSEGEEARDAAAGTAWTDMADVADINQRRQA